jgi:hypothetical protein
MLREICLRRNRVEIYFVKYNRNMPKRNKVEIYFVKYAEAK